MEAIALIRYTDFAVLIMALQILNCPIWLRIVSLALLVLEIIFLNRMYSKHGKFLKSYLFFEYPKALLFLIAFIKSILNFKAELSIPYYILLAIMFTVSYSGRFSMHKD